MKVDVEDCQNSSLILNKKEIESVIREIIAFENICTDEIALHFVNKDMITDLHTKYFDDPTPTDCITFPVDSPHEKKENGYHVLGEVFVCPQVALEYASQHDKNPYEELTLYIIHGILHLIGYKDGGEEIIKMRKKESEIFSYLADKGLLLKG